MRIATASPPRAAIDPATMTEPMLLELKLRAEKCGAEHSSATSEHMHNLDYSMFPESKSGGTHPSSRNSFRWPTVCMNCSMTALPASLFPA